jgi:hypothetical protein
MKYKEITGRKLYEGRAQVDVASNFIKKKIFPISFFLPS